MLQPVIASTRKLAVSQSPRDFLIPAPPAVGGAGFLTLRKGRRVPQAVIAFVDTPVSARDLLSRMPQQLLDLLSQDAWLSFLDAYVGQVQLLKIGNMVEARAHSDGLSLTVVASRPRSPRSPLPD